MGSWEMGEFGDTGEMDLPLPADLVSGGWQEPHEQEPQTVGLSFDDVALLLATRLNGFQVGRNDPLMALVLINNAHLTEVQKLLARHNTALTQVMEHSTNASAQAIQEEAKKVVQGLEQSSITSAIATITAHQKAMAHFLTQVELLVQSARFYTMVTIGGSFFSLFFLAVVMLLWKR